MSKNTECEETMPEPNMKDPMAPEPQEIVIDGPVSLRFAEQLAQVFPLRLPGNHDTEREIFRNVGRQEVMLLVMQAAQSQSEAGLRAQVDAMKGGGEG